MTRSAGKVATGKKLPKVSVCVVTYNQERCIAQCLQSVVDQETNFDFEIIVADDFSTDQTREIVLDFDKKYPDMFRLFLHEENIGALPNFQFVHEQAVGEYVAHLDGDDYFLPGKLQAQADLLDNDKTCNLVWTPAFIETAPGCFHEQNAYFKENALTKRYEKPDLIRYGTIGTNSSKMYRKLLTEENLPLPSFDLIDYFVNVIQVGNGVARFTGAKPLVVYRIGIGIASDGSKTKNLTLRSIEYFSRVMPQYRLQCNIAAGVHLLTDIKNRSPELMNSLKCFVRTFHLRGFYCIFKNLRFHRCLTLCSNAKA